MIEIGKLGTKMCFESEKYGTNDFLFTLGLYTDPQHTPLPCTSISISIVKSAIRNLSKMSAIFMKLEIL